MNAAFFFKLSAELVEIAEQDMRINVLTRDDGECENLKVIGIGDKDGHHPCVKVEDEDGDPFYIFIEQIISITPTEAIEEDEEDGDGPEDDVTPEEDA